jgi:hypothetical protein
MLEAQQTLTGWIENKLADAKRDLSSAESVFNLLQKAKLRTQPASTLIRKARMRITMYDKVAAALAAGYYLIPPFDVQVFAIRTDRRYPSRKEATYDQSNVEADARRLPVGEGEFKNPVALREDAGYTETKKNHDGTTRDVTVYANTEFDDLELPARAMKPTIIEATHKALREKIFDTLGIAPSYRSSDPLIVGQIKHWNRLHEPLTFFVAWWTDERDL